MRSLNTYLCREAPLSEGVNTEVLRARDCQRGIDVVIKKFYDNQIEFGRAEAKLLKLLNKKGCDPKLLDEIEQVTTHPNSPRKNMYGFSLQYLPGINGVSAFQPQRLPTYNPRRVGAALIAAIDLAADVEELHDIGIIHNDIKPGNIFLLPDGCYRLIDFGFAFKKSRRGPTPCIGTLGYAAPEQIEICDHSKRISVCEQTDHWGIGATLYTLLTGKRLIRCSMSEVIPLISRGLSGGELYSEIEEMLIRKTLVYDAETLSARESPFQKLPIVWSMREEILRTIKRCLRLDPADRFQTTTELLTDLRRTLYTFERKYGPVDHRPNSKPYGEEYYKFMRQARRRRATEKAKSQ